MDGIQITGLDKRYGAVEVIRNFNLEIERGEFFVFLGPSGCGKSTLLRMIAGLDSVSAGQIHIAGRDVTQLAPGARGVAMVFQHYALYSHMTVYENMAFGLRNVRLPAAEIDRRVQEAARMLELAPLLQRRPAQMSGGQRQRVAIGRAIVKDPYAFLFDEPLSNLDAALRSRTRVELARLHQRLQSTMIFVTHDQVEAMTLATRIVVMNEGKVEQVGRPMDIYRQPASRFVAGFIGSPAMNFIAVELAAERAGAVAVRLPDGSVVQTTVAAAGLPGGGRSGCGGRADHYTLGVRPEALVIDHSGPAGLIAGRVELVERLGDQTHVHVVLGCGSSVVAHAHRDSEIAAGATVGLRLDAAAVHLFDEAGAAYHAQPRQPQGAA
ncbi:ABC transporter ATP-binding protein [Verminephrobacter eiseniae]|uniref:ABC transporter ATP-binding protein n=1 Tax=Verminephrobacter eiseniae TaxID=364317 RepID=UPI0022389FD3|nr:sn-glycerol-3-phosphate ABC transporter ATP-binding protein UgpC [Verminephrobacter eiseniae]MCW5237828.1 sn-glycerol-3-phosphate ABC transporter ATP-binding protein UgpC [Verminephrobacter eiseniae]